LRSSTPSRTFDCLSLPRDKLDRVHHALLAKWNATYNLTAIREPERMLTHHVLDALAVLPHLPRCRRDRLRCSTSAAAAGVPAIRSRSLRPGWRVVCARQQPQEGRVPASRR
jgi:hypothetical protein